ncbi:hypothetical protein CALVIDRAFT_558716 [Calocera viscosa TUFC12733]|uniref:NACHT domain-containing protein n=1 Tax=Calocera viscosa (strain TUFC12733) TaxID=1330018 RepID=A0A167GBX6_CALVF|nr:hypothetical protein CALVIDRAFT_558716 [Calocera viscosa TUFC12733]
MSVFASVIDEISDFLADQQRREAVRSSALITNSDANRARIGAYKVRLNEVMLLLNTNLTMKMFSKLQTNRNIGQHGRPGLQSEVMRLPPHPSDLPVVRLPPKPRIFYGRETVVPQITSALLQNEETRIAILGTAGIGKTSTAAVVLHDSKIEAKFGRHRIFVSCEAITTADGVISALVAALKITVGQKDDPLQALIVYLRSRGGPVLLTLDNFETPWDSPDQNAVEELLGHLDNVEDLSLLVTMRGTQRPHGVRWSQPALTVLGTMKADAARKIYMDNGGLDGDGLESLLELLDGLPLAIVLMAFQGQRRLPKQLIKAYAQERTALLNRGRKSRLTSLEVSISLSIHCQTMRDDPNALEVLGLLSLLPDGLTESERPNLSWLSGQNKALRVLEDVALVSSSEEFWKVLAPIRDFVLDNHGPAGSHLKELRTYYYGFGADFAANWGRDMSGGQMVVQRVTQVFGNLQAIIKHALSHSDSSMEFFAAVWGLCLFQHNIRREAFLPLLDAALVVGERAPASPLMKTWLSQLRFLRSTAYLALDERDPQAIAMHHERAWRPELEPQGDHFASLDPSHTYHLANLQDKQGHFEEAMRLWRKALEFNEKNNNMLGMSHCHESLRQLYSYQDKLEESYMHFLQARKAFLEMRNVWAANDCLRSMTQVQMMRRRFGPAIPLLLEASSTYDSLGLIQQAASVQRDLALCYSELAMPDEAITAMVTAKHGFVKLQDYRAAVECLQDLASGYNRVGREEDEHAAFVEGVEYCIRHDLKDEATKLLKDKWDRLMSRITSRNVPPRQRER